YYTDRGNLSALLSGSSADAFVANAFAAWTSIPTAAVSTMHAGQLAEDVSGANVMASGNTLNMPSDILASAIDTPVGIVYDADGSVTDALLGAGASNSSFCANNSVFGGIDNFSASAQLLHTLIVVNGNCATSSSQLPDLQYHLVLLCYKKGAPQKGQPESCRSRIRAMVCRSVAMDQGLCRSARTGRTPRVESRRHFGDG